MSMSRAPLAPYLANSSQVHSYVNSSGQGSEIGNMGQRMATATLPITVDELPVDDQDRAAALPKDNNGKNLPGTSKNKLTALKIQVREAPSSSIIRADDTEDGLKDSYTTDELFGPQRHQPDQPASTSHFSIHDLLRMQLNEIPCVPPIPKDQAAQRSGRNKRNIATLLPTLVEETPVDMEIYDSACLSMGYEALNKLKIKPVKPAVRVQKRWFVACDNRA